MQLLGESKKRAESTRKQLTIEIKENYKVQPMTEEITTRLVKLKKGKGSGERWDSK